MSQKVYDLGKICQELAETRGISLDSVDPSNLYKSPTIPFILTEAFRTINPEETIALDGSKGKFSFVYLGETYPGINKKRESLFVEDSRRKIFIAIRLDPPNSILINDKALKEANEFLSKEGMLYLSLKQKEAQTGYQLLIGDKDYKPIKNFLEHILEK